MIETGINWLILLYLNIYFSGSGADSGAKARATAIIPLKPTQA